MSERRKHKRHENRFMFVAAFRDGLRWQVESNPGAVASPENLLSEIEKYCGELREMIRSDSAPPPSSERT